MSDWTNASSERIGGWAPVSVDITLTRLPNEAWAWRTSVVTKYDGIEDGEISTLNGKGTVYQATCGALEALLNTLPGATRNAIKQLGGGR